MNWLYFYFGGCLGFVLGFVLHALLSTMNERLKLETLKKQLQALSQLQERTNRELFLYPAKMERVNKPN